MLYQGSKSSHFILLVFLVVEQLVEWVRCKTVSVSSPWECKTSPNHSTSCTTDQKSIDCWLITWDSANFKALARWRISDVRYETEGETHTYLLTAPSIVAGSRWVIPVAFIWTVHQSPSPEGSRWCAAAQLLWRSVVLMLCVYVCVLGRRRVMLPAS